MNELVDGGIPRDRIVLAIPAHGLYYMLSDPSRTSVGASITQPGPPTTMTNITGLLAFYEVQTTISVFDKFNFHIAI